jgi:hypothetical protein
MLKKTLFDKAKRQDDAAILALFEITAQKIGNRPRICGEVVGSLGHGNVLFKANKVNKAWQRWACREVQEMQLANPATLPFYDEEDITLWAT